MLETQGNEAVAKALVAAMAELKNVGFDSQNSHFKNEYASLPAILDAVRPVLAIHGLAVCHEIEGDETAARVSLLILHQSGRSIRLGPAVVPLAKKDAQGWGSAVTYARRYTLLAALGITGDYDDDAEAAVPARKGAR